MMGDPRTQMAAVGTVTATETEIVIETGVVLRQPVRQEMDTTMTAAVAKGCRHLCRWVPVAFPRLAVLAIRPTTTMVGMVIHPQALCRLQVAAAMITDRLLQSILTTTAAEVRRRKCRTTRRMVQIHMLEVSVLFA